MRRKLRVGVIGVGTAGAQHAIVLSNMQGVTVVAGADPVNGIELFDQKKKDPWYIAGSKWYADESDMLAEEQIDALVLAPDPLSVPTKGPTVGMFEPRPTLWERPVGCRPEVTALVESVEREAPFSVVTFSRFGVVEQVRRALQSGTIALGNIVSFGAFISLSIPPFERKPWRWDLANCQLPIHLLDHVYDTLMFLELPPITSVRGSAKYEYLWGRTIDQSWSISLRLGNGALGSITAVQYPYEREYLLPMQRIEIVGTQGAIRIAPGVASYVDKAGKETSLTQTFSASIRKTLKKPKDILVRFLVDREGYVDSPATHAAAESLVLCDWHWVQNAIGARGFKSTFPLGSIADSARCLRIGNAIVDSAKRNVEVTISY